MIGVCAKTFLFNNNYFAANWLTLSISNLVAFISGLFAVGFLMRYLGRHSLAIFGWYRIILASIMTILLFFAVL
jgi:undecaprenyl-diphosphatase